MKRRLVHILLAIFWSWTCALKANVVLPHIIGSHMVLQRERPIVIWGWADVDEKIAISFDEHTKNTVADKNGNWRVSFPPLSADGKAHRLILIGNNKIELEDILIGEVWLGSGQSNMRWPVSGSPIRGDTIAKANHPTIRLFNMPESDSMQIAKDIKANWRACAPETIADFSELLYFFGVKIQSHLNLPVGLINGSYGGTAIETWLVPPGTKSNGRKTSKRKLSRNYITYNAMIAPVTQFAIRGTLWYQGENNIDDGLKYFDKLRILITGWRRQWGYEFPFYFVQVGRYSQYGPNYLPPLWEAQMEALKTPKTGMIITSDIVDDINDLHPKNKPEMGNRLATMALVKTYNRKGVYSGPFYRTMKIDKNRIRLQFAHAESGLKSRNNLFLNSFEIAGRDRIFYPA